MRLNNSNNGSDTSFPFSNTTSITRGISTEVACLPTAFAISKANLPSSSNGILLKIWANSVASSLIMCSIFWKFADPIIVRRSTTRRPRNKHLKKNFLPSYVVLLFIKISNISFAFDEVFAISIIIFSKLFDNSSRVCPGFL